MIKSKIQIKKLVEKEEVVEGEIVKTTQQIIVGRMKYYPLKIMFPENASTKEKILLIACRIFLLYMSNFAPTMRDLFIFDTCKNTIKDELEDKLNDTLKKPFGKIGEFAEKINDFRETYNDFRETYNDLQTLTINKNIVSINNSEMRKKFDGSPRTVHKKKLIMEMNSDRQALLNINKNTHLNISNLEKQKN